MSSCPCDPEGLAHLVDASRFGVCVGHGTPLGLGTGKLLPFEPCFPRDPAGRNGTNTRRVRFKLSPQRRVPKWIAPKDPQAYRECNAKLFTQPFLFPGYVDLAVSAPLHLHDRIDVRDSREGGEHGAHFARARVQVPCPEEAQIERRGPVEFAQAGRHDRPVRLPARLFDANRFVRATGQAFRKHLP